MAFEAFIALGTFVGTAWIEIAFYYLRRCLMAFFGRSDVLMQAISGFEDSVADAAMGCQRILIYIFSLAFTALEFLAMRYLSDMVGMHTNCGEERAAWSAMAMTCRSLMDVELVSRLESFWTLGAFGMLGPSMLLQLLSTKVLAANGTLTVRNKGAG